MNEKQPRNQKAARISDWIRARADNGDAVAQFQLADFYMNGFGVTKDSSIAISWYKKSAEKGEKYAVECLRKAGVHFKVKTSILAEMESERDVPQTFPEMSLAEIKHLASFKGDARAQLYLASKYLSDHPHDYTLRHEAKLILQELIKNQTNLEAELLLQKVTNDEAMEELRRKLFEEKQRIAIITGTVIVLGILISFTHPILGLLAVIFGILIPLIFKS